MEELRKQFMSQEKLLTLLQSNASKFILILGGLLLLVGGFFLSKNFAPSDKVEILGETSGVATSSAEIVVEVSGAVLTPGVYKLPSGSRINDAIVAAGGLSEDADRSWVEKTINKAAKVLDGQKIYIKEIGSQKTDTGNGTGNIAEPAENGLININSASQKELESLSGIGPVYASNIIEHRPYSTIEELVSRKVIGQSVFAKIKDKISIY